MSNNKAIVFGGAGFLGSHVSDSLSNNGFEVTIYDIKESSQQNDYWNVYRGNYMITGEFIYESLCVSGDLNVDGIINILDIVRVVNIIVDPTLMTEDEECAADLNSDAIINILDIVTLVNIIVDESN